MSETQTCRHTYTCHTHTFRAKQIHLIVRIEIKSYEAEDCGMRVAFTHCADNQISFVSVSVIKHLDTM